MTTASAAARHAAEVRLLLSLLLLMVGTTWAALALGRRRALALPGGLLALLGSAAWLHFDRRLEGPLLLEISRHHGLVLADLAAVPALLLVLALAADALRRSGGRRGRGVERSAHLPLR